MLALSAIPLEKKRRKKESVYLLQPLNCLTLFMEKDTVFILLLTFNSSPVNVLDYELFCEVPNSLHAKRRNHKYITLIAYISRVFIVSKSKFLKPQSYFVVSLQYVMHHLVALKSDYTAALYYLQNVCMLSSKQEVLPEKLQGKKHTVRCPTASKIASYNSWHKTWRTKLCQ